MLLGNDRHINTSGASNIFTVLGDLLCYFISTHSVTHFPFSYIRVKPFIVLLFLDCVAQADFELEMLLPQPPSLML